MNCVKQEDLVVLRGLLTERSRALRGDVLQAGAARRGSLTGETHEVTDRKDAAAAQVAERVLSAEEERDRGELARIDDALARMKSGTYGLCADCGECIPTARLRAQPAAARCATCESAREAVRLR